MADAYAQVSSSEAAAAVSFTIPLTDAIRTTLQTRLNLKIAVDVSSVPLRWIRGDTAPHIDTGSCPFEYTYLVYLAATGGQLVINDTDVYPIEANRAYVFPEGSAHSTRNTGTEPRLLLGPMNEFILPVGASILYYATYEDAVAHGGNYIAYSGSTIVDDPPAYGTLNGILFWKVITYSGAAPPPQTFGPGDDLSPYITAENGFSLALYPATAPPSNTCFVANTNIRTDRHGQVPIQNLDKRVHTINGGQRIQHITRIVSESDSLVEIPAHSIARNMPYASTRVSRNHKILYLGRFIKAHELIQHNKAVSVPYIKGDILYNVLLEECGKMVANGLVVETLDPNNGVARLFRDLNFDQLSHQEQSCVVDAIKKRRR